MSASFLAYQQELWAVWETGTRFWVMLCVAPASGNQPCVRSGVVKAPETVGVGAVSQDADRPERATWPVLCARPAVISAESPFATSSSPRRPRAHPGATVFLLLFRPRARRSMRSAVKRFSQHRRSSTRRRRRRGGRVRGDQAGTTTAVCLALCRVVVCRNPNR